MADSIAAIVVCRDHTSTAAGWQDDRTRVLPIVRLSGLHPAREHSSVEFTRRPTDEARRRMLGSGTWGVAGGGGDLQIDVLLVAGCSIQFRMRGDG